MCFDNLIRTGALSQKSKKKGFSAVHKIRLINIHEKLGPRKWEVHVIGRSRSSIFDSSSKADVKAEMRLRKHDVHAKVLTAY